jgi:hypothetical protein
MQEKTNPRKNKSLNDSAKTKGSSKEDTMISPAHEQADKDMQQDPDLTKKRRPEDDKDEGELARLEGEG